MLPGKLVSTDDISIRRKYRVISRWNMKEVPGLIVSACVETGECVMQEGDDSTKKHDFGPDGLRIVGR